MIHTFTTPGSYSPTLKVVDSDGLSDTDSCSVTVEGGDDLRVWVSKPEDGDSIWGEAVNLRANTAPGNLTGRVKFQYKGTTDTVWNDVSGWITPPPYSFSDMWDVTGLESGKYYALKAVAEDTSGNLVSSPIILIKVENEGAEVEEGYDGDGNPAKKVKVYIHKNQEVITNDNTSVEIPFGALSADTTLNITSMGNNPHADEGENDALKSFKRMTLENDTKIQKAITIVIPYKDENKDGYVDGTDIPETELGIYWYEAVDKKWKPIGNCSIDSEKNIVIAKVIHFTDFAVAPRDFAWEVAVDEASEETLDIGVGYDTNVTAGGGGGGGCFLTITGAGCK